MIFRLLNLVLRDKIIIFQIGELKYTLLGFRMKHSVKIQSQMRLKCKLNLISFQSKISRNFWCLLLLIEIS